MKTVGQVTKLTGVSARSLQYYDEIDLLKPTEVTDAGYRLYDEDALQKLQQILFFKELDFQLKEIKEILDNPNYDKIAAYKKQKELLLLKRSRTDKLIQLLERLEKGEACVSFKAFDLTKYIEALQSFKNSQQELVMKHWGNVENFEMLISKIKENEEEVARLAVKQFGSVEEYTEAMKYNLEHFGEIMEKKMAEVPEEMKIEDLFTRLAAYKREAGASEEIFQTVKAIIAEAQGCSAAELVGNEKGYCKMIIDTYSNEYMKRILNAKNGDGYAEYIVEAFEEYMANVI